MFRNEWRRRHDNQSQGAPWLRPYCEMLRFRLLLFRTSKGKLKWSWDHRTMTWEGYCSGWRKRNTEIKKTRIRWKNSGYQANRRSSYKLTLPPLQWRERVQRKLSASPALFRSYRLKKASETQRSASKTSSPFSLGVFCDERTQTQIFRKNTAVPGLAEQRMALWLGTRFRVFSEGSHEGKGTQFHGERRGTSSGTADFDMIHVKTKFSQIPQGEIWNMLFKDHSSFMAIG